MLEPEYKEVVLGRAEVRETFKVPKVGTIAGCYVIDGKITRSASLKLVRDSIVIFDGKILSLRRFKDDAKEVQAGFECGIGIEGFNDIHVGDIIEAYTTKNWRSKAVERRILTLFVAAAALILTALVNLSIMVIGYGIIQLRIPESGSLKEKRSVLSKIIKRTQNEFNVSIAEIGDLDNHKLAQIGFAFVGNDSRYINGKVDHLLKFVDDLRAAEMLNSKIEIMVVSDFLEADDWECGQVR